MLTSAPVSLIIFIIGFGFLVFVHELGHFLVAKWVGVRATQFAIGFGPAMISYRPGLGIFIGCSSEKMYQRMAKERIQEKAERRGRFVDPDDITPKQIYESADAMGMGETEYRLNYIPLGGYVKMLGQEDLNPNAATDDPRAFNRKPIWARACVISAGVIMNMIFGLIFFIMAFTPGVDFPSSQIGYVRPNFPAATTFAVGHENNPAFEGLRPGDRIVAINGRPMSDMMEVQMKVALSGRTESLHLEVERPGHDQPLHFNMQPIRDPDMGMRAIGVAPISSLEVGLLDRDGPIYAAGVRPGMVATHAAGRPLDSYVDLLNILGEHRGMAAPVTFVDPETQQTTTAPLSATAQMQVDPQHDMRHLLGLVPAVQITAALEDSPAARAGVQAGDLLAQVDGTHWPAASEVSALVRQAAEEGRGVRIAVLRQDMLHELGEIRPRQGRIGVQMSEADLIISQILPDSPASIFEADDRVPGGSSLRSINGQRIVQWQDAVRVIQQHLERNPEQPLRVELQLAITRQPTVAMSIDLTEAQRAELAALQFLDPMGIRFRDKLVTISGDNPWQACVLGFKKTHQYMVQTYLTLLRLIQRDVPATEMRGPVGIAHVGMQVTQQGMPRFFFLLGLISVNLAVLNFLPIPIVDGGLMLFLLYEKIKGSPPGEKLQTVSLLFGLALIASVFLFVTYNDIMRLFS